METAHLFDLVFKKLITSSPRGVIYLINALFNTTFPLDSPVEYLSTEHIGEDLGLRRSDTMIKINNSHTYNLEAQTKKGREMVVRVFEYGFMQARDNQILTKEKIRLAFPMPKIIYLDARGKIPDTVTLELKFPDDSIHEYKVGTFKIHDHAGILENKDINAIQSLMERLVRELYAGYTEMEGVDTMLVTEIKTYAEELEEKIAEREWQNKLDSARSLKAMDVPVDKIVKALGLSLEVVEKL
ncbi:hypothetical protein [Leadbettera azotonutricia]|uniref:Uncharacterized protein n=1 Tax=Leadbettera azotonutricia (strain ATCC BAA-888 / DSM 13862 / ZAS-9) TaxID=545695 RepID=F5YE49_LEAAZ|nr:hypothetical protein [Leadbettera azotonutricia]AEF80381.1 hypothetical protein TREAZ_0279 [Leadbettera azotonutricia ZAS-9]